MTNDNTKTEKKGLIVSKDTLVLTINGTPYDLVTVAYGEYHKYFKSSDKHFFTYYRSIFTDIAYIDKRNYRKINNPDMRFDNGFPCPNTVLANSRGHRVEVLPIVYFLSSDEIAYLLSGGSECELADNEFMALVIAKVFGPPKDEIMEAKRRLRRKETELQVE